MYACVFMLYLYVICTVKLLTKPALAKGCQGERNRCDSKAINERLVFILGPRRFAHNFSPCPR